MVARTAWLRRERLAFAASALLLAAVGVYAVGSRPAVGDPGAHRTMRSAPRELGLFLEEPGDVRDFLAGGRANPFESLRPDAGAPAGPAKEDGPAKVQDTVPKDLFRPVKGDDVGRGQATRLPVPVNFVAVVRAAGGEPCVVLKDRKTGENRRRVEGDNWPEINLRILRISMSSVLLEGAGGERFQMLDLYGRKATGRDPGAADGAGRG
jgi:hypothetical protein